MGRVDMPVEIGPGDFIEINDRDPFVLGEVGGGLKIGTDGQFFKNIGGYFKRYGCGNGFQVDHAEHFFRDHKHQVAFPFDVFGDVG